MNAQLFESDGAARIAVCVIAACKKLGISHKVAQRLINAVVCEVAVNDLTHPANGKFTDADITSVTNKYIQSVNKMFECLATQQNTTRH